MRNQITISVVITHFGDWRWTKLLVSRLLECDSDILMEIIIVNQDRTPQISREVQSSDSRIQIIEPPIWNLNQVSKPLSASFDHGSSLNFILRKMAFKGDFVLILDNDCFPMNPSWIDDLILSLDNHDAVIAEAPKTMYLSHPCLMLFPRESAEYLDFLQGMLQLGFDTGRLVGLQLCNMNLTPKIERASREKEGMGFSYVNRSFLHLVATSYSQWRSENFTEIVRFQHLKLDFKFFVLNHWYLDGFKIMTKARMFSYFFRFLGRRFLKDLSDLLQSAELPKSWDK